MMDLTMRKRSSSGLGVLKVFFGVGAVAGGLGLALDPSGANLGIPLGLLEETPFARHRYAGEAAMALGAFLQ